MGIPGSFTVKFSYGEPVSLSHFEVFVGTSPGFTITGWDGNSWIGEPNDPADWDGVTNTLRVVSRSRPIDVLDLTPGERYYVRVVAVNRSRMRSIPSNEASGVAKKVGSNDYGDGSVGTIHIVQDAVSGLEVLEVADSTGTWTTSSSFVDIPGFSVTFSLAERATVLFYYSVDLLSFGNTMLQHEVSAETRLVFDGVAVPSSQRVIQYLFDADLGQDQPTGDLRLRGTTSGISTRSFGAGQHTMKVQYREHAVGNIVTAFHRILGVLILKR